MRIDSTQLRKIIREEVIKEMRRPDPEVGVMSNANETELDALTDAILSHGGDIVITDMLNDWRYGDTSKWDIVREILRMAAEATTATRAKGP